MFNEDIKSVKPVIAVELMLMMVWLFIRNVKSKKSERSCTEYLLINHPLDVLFVIKGENVITRFSIGVGGDKGRFYEYKRVL